MRKMIWIGIAAVILIFCVTMAQAQEDDIAKYTSCKYCGMDRKTFAHTRMLVAYDDQSVLGACSIHCLAVDLAIHIDKTPMSIQVGDFNTKTLIDAEKAVWVIGGNKPGVMTKRAKWAFAKMPDAEAFVKENGGNIAAFDDAMKAAYEDMYSDTKMIREKRKMKRMQKGN